jgi:hypothetical protein
MRRKLLVYIGSLLTIFWGIAHIFPLNKVVMGFGNISIDNVHIIQMEWLTEAYSLIFIGLLTILVTIISRNDRKVANAVYILVFIMLIQLSVLSIITAFKIDFLPYKLCPLIFTTAGIMILQGAFYQKEQLNFVK